ncbi:hypothetical protein E8E13_000303 [Curvularia kusanoi]|uniref:Cytochrome P450 n=1 Tax=Curvularia kusanoi TaxID=90978 RepID=A0A9P4T4U6_CURKU|nr:hypothetical protein E8E13_000303 [Curvularia kusanoi]
MSKEATDRKDILTSLIKAVDPESGAKLTELDINTEAFAMLVAGSHTTSGTLTLLFAHLLRSPTIMQKVLQELDSKLDGHGTKSYPYPIAGLEDRLPYTMACIQENFRINPVFTMPLPREVTAAEGMSIDGHSIPKGYLALIMSCTTLKRFGVSNMMSIFLRDF